MVLFMNVKINQTENNDDNKNNNNNKGNNNIAIK